MPVPIRRIGPACKDPGMIVFIEHWSDRDALATHFAVPESAAFVRGLRAHVTASPTIETYAAEQITL